MVRPVSASAASTRSAPRWATPSSTARTTWARSVPAGEAEQRPAGAVVPLRRAEPEEGRHVHDAVGRRRPTAATSWLSALVAMSPRSSRSHSTLLPADSMIASTPHVMAPPRDHAAIGNVPWWLRAAVAGGSVAVADVEHAAGAERDLGPAGPDAALADERALLVADEGGDRRGAGQRRGVADDAGGVDERGQDRGRDAEGVEDAARSSPTRRPGAAR